MFVKLVYSTSESGENVCEYLVPEQRIHPKASEVPESPRNT